MLDVSNVKDKELSEKLVKVARQAAKIAARVQGVPDILCYQIELGYYPRKDAYGFYNDKKKKIVINLSYLQPMSVIDRPDDLFYDVEEEKHLSEKERVGGYCNSVTFVIFHEVRHLYQANCIRAYRLNKLFGENICDQHEDDITCNLWEKEMTGEWSSPDCRVMDIEVDAAYFSVYMFHRYPVSYRYVKLNDRLKDMKKRYDKMPIPEAYGDNAGEEA